MYITSSEYNALTGRPAAEATAARIKRASQSLDARIGNHRIMTTGWKLEIDELPADQQAAVKEWTARMIAYLTENGDEAPSTDGVTLGKFSLSKSAGNSGSVMGIPGEMRFADNILVSTGLIKRKVRLT